MIALDNKGQVIDFKTRTKLRKVRVHKNRMVKKPFALKHGAWSKVKSTPIDDINSFIEKYSYA